MNFLSKKMGGLPIWGWALIGAAGIAAGAGFLWWQKRSAATTASGTSSAVATPDTTTGLGTTEEDVNSGVVPNTGLPTNNSFPESVVNGQQVPVIPPGYQAIYDGNGNLIGFEPVVEPPPVAGQPNPPPTTGGTQQTVKAIQEGAIASVAGGTWVGGKNIGTLPSGAIATLLGGPNPVTVNGVVNHYYQISYNNQTGWVNAKTIGLA